MDLLITSETSLEVMVGAGPLNVDIDSDDAHAQFGPLQMLATSLALCTLSVLSSYAETAHLHIDGAKLLIEWDYADEPHRVGAYRLQLQWPEELTEARQKALLRAAEYCTVHTTLQHPPTIELTLDVATNDER